MDSQGSEKISKPLSAYEIGRTVATASQIDQRFSYCLYVPRTLVEKGTIADAKIVVALHGTDRRNETLRDLFVPFADENDVVILSPLFPAGILEPNELDSYKYVEFRDIRFDLLLLGMIEEVGARYGMPTDKIAMFGFSGGAHLAHRFMYLHPERLNAVSICAPGSPTLLNSERDWWVGTKDVEERFNRSIDIEEIRKLQIQLAVGTEDIGTNGISHKPGSPNWMEGANDAGETRVDRLRTLAANLADHEIRTRLDLLPGIGHDREKLVEAATDFFCTAISGSAR